jgi:branched-chain amino acid transport system ATP-binding protein
MCRGRFIKGRKYNQRGERKGKRPTWRQGHMTEVSSRTAAGPHEGGNQQLLEIARVSMRFGGIVALDDVNFAVSKGRIVGLIGPNGAGKTTLFNCLSRLYQPERGDIRLNGKSLLDSTPSDIAALGIGRTFQSPALFASMTVLDNVKVGAHARGRNRPLRDAVTLPARRREEHEFDRIARAMLAFVEMEKVAGRPSASLSLGARKRVELARSLAADPLLLLLDEPAGGLNHEEVAELGILIRSIRDKLGITVLLVEHHMGLVMSLSDQIVVLNFGRVIADGPPAAVRSNPVVAEAYLGTRQ